MSFPRYEKYKDSGISWLGEIPSHWQARRAKFLFDRKQRPVSDDDDIVTAFRDGQVTLRKNRREDGFTVALKEIGYQGVRQGDLVIHAMDAFAGAVGVSDSDGKCSPVYSCCEPKEKVLAPFYGYLVRTMALAGFIESLAKGVRERSTDFRWGDFSSLELPLPPVEEQKQAVSFIANETGKIDALVAEQEKLIGLLKEKRQAVISHAVTKGLDPNARMKDSGVEWLGEVPEGWKVVMIRRCLIEHRQGYYSSNPYSESGVKLLRITDLRDHGSVSFDDCPFVEHEEGISPFLLQQGDFVFARTGGAGSFGVIGEIKELVAYASYLIRFRFDTSSVTTEFLRFFFHSDCFQKAIKQNIHGGVNQNVHAEDIKDQYIAIPSESEQLNIASFLITETAKFDTLIEEAQKAIELMKERRTALISAAVTGKIDVSKAQ